MDTWSSGRFSVFEIEINLNADTRFSLSQRTVQPLHWRESICYGCRTCTSTGWQRASYLLCFQVTLKITNKYSATRHELLALVTFTRHFRHYLLGQKFTKSTDHSALQWLHSFKDPDGITARWLEKLAPFDYEVHHRPGKSIAHADGLSRIPPNSINAIETDPP